MSGIQHGKRLDRLRDLERAVKVQIELEELAESRGRVRVDPCAAYPSTDTAPATAPHRSPERTTVVRVPLEHVATPTIRKWARANRYDVAPQGPIERFVLGAFIEAHQ
jgi:hypothetical protein